MSSLACTLQEKLVEQIKNLPESLQETIIQQTVQTIRDEERKKFEKELEFIPSLIEDFYSIVKSTHPLNFDVFDATIKSKIDIAIIDGIKRILEAEERERHTNERTYMAAYLTLQDAYDTP